MSARSAVLRVVRPPAKAAPAVPVRTLTLQPAPALLRPATAGDAAAIHQLIADHVAEGHLLPREQDEIAAHAERFIVVTRGRAVVACAELAPLSATVAEIRSLVVGRAARGGGIGTRLVDAVAARAAADGFGTLCAFAHAPGYFVQMGFSIVPHHWVPEKIATDCHGCRHFRQCGQYAVTRALQTTNRVDGSKAAQHG